MRLRLTEEQRKEVTSLVVDCFNYSKQFFTPYYNLCGILDDLYRVKLPAEIERDLSDDNPGLVPPDIHLAVNNLLSRFDEIFFSADPPFRCTGGVQTSEQTIENVMAFMKLASEKSDLELNIVQSLLSAIKFACGVGYVDIKEVDLYSLKNNAKLQVETEEGESENPTELYYTDFVKDGKFLCPTYIPCNLRRHFPDPDGMPGKWAIQQSKVTLLDLLEDQENGELSKYDLFDYEKIKKTSFPGGEFNEFFDKKDFKSSTMKDYNMPIELLHFRGWMPIPQKDPTKRPKFVDCITTVANRTELIQAEVNGWHFPAVESFIKTFLFPNDLEILYPVGKIEASADSFYNLFYLRNQKLMSLDRILNPMYRSDDPEGEKYLQAEGGKIIRTTRGATFEPLRMEDISNKAYIEVDSIKDEIRWIHHSNEYSAGIDPRRKETATGVNALSRSTDTSTRFEYKIAARTGVLKILERYKDFGQVFLEKIPVKLANGEVRTIDKRDLFGDISISLKINETYNKPLQRQEMQEVVALYRGDPDIDQIDLKKRHFTLLEFTDIDKLVPDQAINMIPVDKENMLMVQQGVFVPVHPQENHALHLKGHAQFQGNPIVDQHSQQHMAQYQQQQNAMATKMGGKQLPGSEEGLMRSMAQGLQ